jgi:hypothetical protein
LDEGIYLTLQSGAFSFDLFMKCVLHHTSFFISDVYTDSASMQVDVKYNDVTISKVQNHAPSVLPALGSYGDATVVWVPDLIGVMNIDEKNSTGTNDDDNNEVKIKLVHTNTVYPLWNIQDNHDSGHMTQGGFKVTGYPTSFEISKRDLVQIINIDISNGLDYVEITATPIH